MDTMNAPAFTPRTGYQRLRLTVDDVDKMAEIGVIDPDAKTELIGGELTYMPSEGELHINYKVELVRWLVRKVSDDFKIAPDASLHLDRANVPQPDLYVFSTRARLMPIDPAQVQLVVEIADSSLGRDLETKASLYARFGISEYWVVDIGAHMTHLHLKPSGGEYVDVKRIPFGEAISPHRLPGLPPLIIADFTDLK